MTLFTENFENGQGARQDQLPSYTGPAPLNETYSADPVWLSNCSGWISSLAEGPNDPPGSICDNVYATQGEPAAAALGTWAGNDPNTNHAVVSLTSQNAPYANKAELQTNTPIPVPANHYLTTSIDATDVGCGGVPTELDLLLLNGSTAIDTTPNLIEPCLHPQGNVNGIPVGTYVGNAATLFSGSAAGIEVVSRQNGANGNDGGFDNLKILDVTPQLDMGFVTSPVPQRASVTLVYTITNSSELDAKNGWSFTNTLPAGLVADPASATTNCGSVSATAGAVSVAGNLAAGQTFCTATVSISATAPGQYADCPTDITASVGLYPPLCAGIHFNAEPTVHTGGPYSGQEASPISLAGIVSDPDGPTLHSTWSIAPAAGGDPGATCSFGNAAAPATTVTCTDEGTYTLTLTAADGLNPPVSATTTLTLTGAAPAVSISAPGNGTLFTRGTPVTVTAPFTDIGVHDTHTCTVDYGDGSPPVTGTVTESSGSGTCSATHAYTALGAHSILVTIADEDGDHGTAAVSVVVFVPGDAFGVQASGLITVDKTPDAACPPNASLTTASLSLGIGTINALHADCTLDPATGTTTANASVAGASLLLGAITVTDVNAHCVAGASGLSSSSNVGTINGTPIGSASGSLGIPGVATVFFNEASTTPTGQLQRDAVRVHTPLGQDIILAGCRLG